ncbi:MAG: glutaredoxin [Kofleriaceae bacterium]|nr:glutaredoxin [Kofleriaceae bacterium]
MPRDVLPEPRLHTAIREKIANLHRDIVEEVKAAIAAHDIVVVGMAINPHPGRARRALAAKGIPFHYIGYGSYFGGWRKRTALKMWTGWPTFPMVFVKGTLVGGASDLQKLIESGELDNLRLQSAAGSSTVGG